TDNGRELIIINQHLSAYGTDAAQGNAQLEKLLGDMKKEYEKSKVWAEFEERVTYDKKTGWMISYKSKETFHSSEGDSSQSMVINLK
ncbi:MAG: hypothetical protein IKZ67_00910, partial [Paludibacteraceae bacterium]|nr:hypothetical protein [Paludibacteraceae bacterium]